MACIDSSAREIIPIFFAFDNNYAIPAGVAFYSLMTFASKKYDYKFIVLHEDITEDNQSSLFKTLASFDNVSLEFRYMGDQFKDEWDGLTVKGHYTKECLYKLIPVNYFMEYDRIIWSDVDVLFKDDISDIYFMLSSDNYLAGVRVCGKLDRHYELMDMPVCVKEIVTIQHILKIQAKFPRPLREGVRGWGSFPCLTQISPSPTPQSPPVKGGEASSCRPCKNAE